MIILGLVIALLTLLLAGVGVALLAQRGRATINVLETWALAWFFGTGAISLLLWSGGMILSGLALQLAVTACAVMLGLLGFAAARKDRVRVTLPWPRGAAEWILTGVIVVEIAFMYYAALGTNLGWDGVFNWEVKARYAFLNHGVLPAAYFQDRARVFTHPAYPLWVPFTELWLYLWMDAPHQFWIKLLFPAFYAMGVIWLVTIAARLTGARWAGLLVGALIFLVPCLTNGMGGAQEGFVDVPLALLYLGTIGYLLLIEPKADAANWRLYALCLALLPWAKREGAVLWLVALGCGLLVLWRTQRSWRDLLWLWPGAVIALSWKFFLNRMLLTGGDDFAPATFATLMGSLPRLGPIAGLLRDELTATPRWSIFWLLVALSFVALLCRARDRRLLVLILAIVLPVLAYTGAYFFSSWGDWIAHVNASLTRLLLQVMPVAWLAIAWAIAPRRVQARDQREQNSA